MRNLKLLKKPLTIDEYEAYAEQGFTIFEKIEFSGISKETIKAKLKDLYERQVPQRKVLLEMSDYDCAQHWFKNWLHPSLKNFYPASPRVKRGCSQTVLMNDARKDSLRFYENGQQNYNYTLTDIEEYCGYWE